ncbi:MAG: Hsp20 family protein [Saprospiraceae bacterium]|nr:Hsp20 family protein [Saprospiraceae bacterium]
MRTQRKFTGISPRNTQQRSVDRFFNSRYRDLLNIGDVTDTLNLPMVNEKHSDGDFQLEVAIPGVDKEDIYVYVEDGYIQVMVEDTQKIKSSADNYKTKEFNYYSLNQKFTIPEEADEEQVVASYENGVLYISVPVSPQVEETTLRRSIDIK